MMNMMNEGIIQLAKAQESMIDMVKSIDQWKHSQLTLEKSAFETMNTADTILNLSKDGNGLVERLQDCFFHGMKNVDTEKARQVGELLENMQSLFHQVLDNAQTANETAHNLEVEVATQREIGEGMHQSMGIINESIETVVACAEFIIADM